MGSANSPRGTSWSNTVNTIRVGRQYTFSRTPVLLTSCVYTDLSADASTTAHLSAAHLLKRDLDFKRCGLEDTEMMRTPLLSLAPMRAQFVVLGLSHSHATCRLPSHLWMTTSMDPRSSRILACRIFSLTVLLVSVTCSSSAVTS